MEIKPPTTTLLPPVAGSSPVAPQSNVSQNTIPPEWKIAQLVEAVIVKITDKQLFLDIQGNMAHTAKPAIANLQAGDSLVLQVKQLSPLPQFAIVDIKQKPAALNIINQALKTLSAEQASTVALMKNMAFVASRPALRPAPLAAVVNAAVREIVRTIPTPANLKSATQIKSLMESSAGYIENKIKNQLAATLQKSTLSQRVDHNSKPGLMPDLKVQLLRLADLIRSQPLLTPRVTTPLTQAAPETVAASQNQAATTASASSTQARPLPASNPELQASLQSLTVRDEAMHTFLRQVENGLSHIQQSQLQSLHESQNGRPVWIFELPVKDGQDIDVFKLRIAEEDNPHASDEAKKTWSVTLEFDFAGLGPVKSHVKLQNNYISALFFSEKPQTLALFNENFDFLRSRLSVNGLNVANLEGIHKPLTADTSITPSPRLSERT